MAHAAGLAKKPRGRGNVTAGLRVSDLMETYVDAARFCPPLRLAGRDGTEEITTLDEALVFAERNPHPKGDYEGMIRRLQGARGPEELVEAGNAFRWWAQSNALLANAPIAPGGAPS
ncbi:hypothetical protein MWN33_09870 [Starkeya koreensis]|uniref:Uncharacterized protein n=1 Tax=Ancylobacter koreensis TaxID=266121 RepID=A0ABT0DM30_9HYPH|nr:hypothetical protein [Ancylobacter koreensis]MCK0208338.1 hypothetical protein [Ancylobacter koreensis]